MLHDIGSVRSNTTVSCLHRTNFLAATPEWTTFAHNLANVFLGKGQKDIILFGKELLSSSARSVVVAFVTLDAVDRKLLRLLQEDGRRSYRSLAEAVDLGAPSVHARVQRLEREGYIRGYHADIDPEKVGKTMTAFVSIGLEGGRKGEVPRTEAVADQLRKDPDVIEVHAITGEDDLLMKVRTSDIRGLERLLLRSLEPLQGVRKTTTNIVVRTLIERDTQP